MSSLINVLAKKINFDNDNMIIDFVDGRKLSIPLAFFPRLLKADSKQRNNYVLSGGGSGIHWEDIDEDIDVQNLLLGFRDNTKTDGSKTEAA